MSVSTDWARKGQCQLTGPGNVKEMSVLTDWTLKCQCLLTGQGNVNAD